MGRHSHHDRHLHEGAWFIVLPTKKLSSGNTLFKKTQVHVPRSHSNVGMRFVKCSQMRYMGANHHTIQPVGRIIEVQTNRGSITAVEVPAYIRLDSNTTMTGCVPGQRHKPNFRFKTRQAYGIKVVPVLSVHVMEYPMRVVRETSLVVGCELKHFSGGASVHDILVDKDALLHAENRATLQRGPNAGASG